LDKEPTLQQLDTSNCLTMDAGLVFQTSFHSFYCENRSAIVDKTGGNSKRALTTDGRVSSIARRGSRMPKSTSPDQNLLIFPGPGVAIEPERENHFTISAAAVPALPRATPQLGLEVVLSGTYRKQFDVLKLAYEEFQDLGCTVLSPSNVSIVREEHGFVYMRGEETQTPESIEERHLEAIQKASFVWLHAPDGYVGPTAALEIGFANAVGVPVYAREMPKDKILSSFVRQVHSPTLIVQENPQHFEPPAPALRAFQEYYKRAAIQRGYTKEGPKECLLLMVEEVGELARAIRKREKLVRHGSYERSNEAQELADVFLYVVHMANVLGLDLASAVKAKESINVEKFLAR
jgi:NTP pyrophosphatase (non-canonical NTP hydrolase)